VKFEPDVDHNYSYILRLCKIYFLIKMFKDLMISK